jgi:hypothetical protein
VFHVPTQRCLPNLVDATWLSVGCMAVPNPHATCCLLCTTAFQQFCLRLGARALAKKGVAISGVDASAFARRELTILSMISQYATRPDLGIPDVGLISQQLVSLLHPYLRPNRRNRLRDPSRDDPKVRVLRIVADLILQVPEPTQFLDYYCSLACPGPHALEGPAREGLVSLFLALGKHPRLAGSRVVKCAALFAEMNAVDRTRIGAGPDFDRCVYLLWVTILCVRLFSHPVVMLLLPLVSRPSPVVLAVVVVACDCPASLARMRSSATVPAWTSCYSSQPQVSSSSFTKSCTTYTAQSSVCEPAPATQLVPW